MFSLLRAPENEDLISGTKFVSPDNVQRGHSCVNRRNLNAKSCSQVSLRVANFPFVSWRRSSSRPFFEAKRHDPTWSLVIANRSAWMSAHSWTDFPTEISFGPEVFSNCDIWGEFCFRTRINSSDDRLLWSNSVWSSFSGTHSQLILKLSNLLRVSSLEEDGSVWHRMELQHFVGELCQSLLKSPLISMSASELPTLGRQRHSFRSTKIFADDRNWSQYVSQRNWSANAP